MFKSLLFCAALLAASSCLAAPADSTTLSSTHAAKRIPWDQALQERSVHFVIITNTNAKLAKEMSQALEQQYADFVRRFQIQKEAKTQLPVKIFAQKAEFQKYIQDQKKSLSEHVAGFYDPTAKEIVLFWSDDPEDVLSTLYHEVTHYFVDLYMPRADAPLWMNEGLATYFETAQFRNGKLEIGQIPYGHLLDLQDALKAGHNHSLAHLLKMEDYKEYNLLAYAEGWALVYFFATFQNGQHGARFGTYMQEIKKGRRPEQAFKTAFLVGPEEIEPIWKDFVLKLGQSSARAWAERGQARWNEGKWEEGLSCCEQALKLDPKDPRARQLKGILLFELNKFPEALEELTQATAADPTQARSFFYLANTHEHLCALGDKRGSAAASEKAYLKAIELRPDYANALGLLAWLYATTHDPKLHKIKEAIPLAQHAVELDPTADVLDTLAECYYQDGQNEKAAETIQKALALNPPNKEYYLEQLKKFQEAKKKP